MRDFVEMKRCTDCRQEKERSEFYASKYARDGLEGICKVCRGKRATASWHSNRKRTRDNVYRRSIKRDYDLSPEQYNTLCDAQGGRCAVCGCFPDDPRNRSFGMLAVDHDHTTGTVRGLLCVACNQMIGLANESREILQHAERYLWRYGS